MMAITTSSSIRVNATDLLFSFIYPHKFNRLSVAHWQVRLGCQYDKGRRQLFSVSTKTIIPAGKMSSCDERTIVDQQYLEVLLDGVLT